MGNERGSITMYALIALSALLLVFALLSDVVRAKAAVADAEEAARRAGRSMLSQFDTLLLDYGLFGARWSEEGAGSVLSALTDADRRIHAGERFSLYADSGARALSSTEPLYHLGDHRVFQQQILERMKYVAGIEFGIEVTEKFAKGRKQIEQAEQYAQLSDELEKLIRRRGKALDDAWSTASSMLNAALSGNANASLQPMLDELTRQLTEAERLNEDIRGSLQAQQTEIGLPPITVYATTMFSEYKSRAGTVASLYAAWQTALREMEAMQREQAAAAASGAEESEDAAEARTRAMEERARRAAALRDQLYRYASEWRADRIEEESRRRQEEQEARRQEEEQKRSAQRELQNRVERMQEVCLPDYILDYHELTKADGLMMKYKTYNEHASSGGIQEELQEDDAGQFLFQALQLTKLIADAAVELRDEVYVNEYALTHFTYLTDSYEQNQLVTVHMGSRQSHRLQRQEAEYILYGLPTCSLNIGAMQAELFALRTALRTVESLMKPNTAAAAASPWAVLLKALAEGAIAANRDLDALLRGESVELPVVKGMTMNYKDHLRLFYLLHSRDASVLSRMQALIEWNTGADLMERYTAVRVRGAVQASGMLLPAGRRQVEAVVSY